MSNQEIFKVSLDAGAIIVEFNEDASNISGYLKNEVINKNWFEIFIPDSDMLEVLKVFSDLFYGSNSHWEYTNDIKCKDGTTKTIKWTNHIVFNKNNRPELITSKGIVVN